MKFNLNTDIVSVLENAAFVFSEQATAARQASQATLANPYRVTDPDQLAEIRCRSAESLASAATWDRRAATARAGKLLMSPSEYADPGYLTTFQDLISQCQSAGRVQVEVAKPAPMTPVPGIQGDTTPGFDRFGQPTESPPAALREPTLADIPGQTIGFDEKGLPIVTR